MHTISRDSPCHYLTAVAKKRLPIFRSDKIRSIRCSALNEARHSGKFSLYAYVVMPDHIHVVTDSALRPSKILQFINGITARRIIDYLKEHNYQDSLKKLRHEIRPRRYSYSLWDHHPDVRLLLTEEKRRSLPQKVGESTVSRRLTAMCCGIAACGPSVLSNQTNGVPRRGSSRRGWV